MSDKGKILWLNNLILSDKGTLNFIETDLKGNVYVAGSFVGTISSNELKAVSNGGNDIFIAKYDKAGTQLKLISFGSDGEDALTGFSVSDSGYIALSASFQKDFLLDKSKEVIPSNSYKNKYTIVRLNSDLVPERSTIVECKDYLILSSIDLDASGNLFVSGSFRQSLKTADTTLFSNGYTDGFVLKYNRQNVFQWAKTFGSWYYDYANHLSVDKLGGIIITGSIGDKLQLDSLAVFPKAVKSSSIAIQFNEKGKVLWAECISGDGRSFSNSSLIDKKGNLLLMGSFKGTIETKGGILQATGDQDLFLAKYFNCITNNDVITGDTWICPGSSVELSVNKSYKRILWNDSIKNQNFFIAQKPGKYTVSLLDKRGCMLYDTALIKLAPTSLFSLGSDLQVPADSSVYLHADNGYKDYKWQDGSTERLFIAKSSEADIGANQFWVTALDSLDCPVSDTIEISFIDDKNWIDLNKAKLVIYPNPTHEILYWYIDLETECNLSIDITDENGKSVYGKTYPSYQPRQIIQIDFGDKPYGHYYFYIKNKEGQKSQGLSFIKR